MSSLNRVTIIGNVGNDPELRYTPNGTAVANLSVATSRTWKDTNGDKQEETEWHRLQCWQRTAEVAGEYVKKGDKVAVEGRLKTREWEDKDGIKRWMTEVIVDNLILLTPKGGGGQREQRSEGERGRQQQRSQGQSRPQSRPQQRTGTGFDDMEDDIPFN